MWEMQFTFSYTGLCWNCSLSQKCSSFSIYAFEILSITPNLVETPSLPEAFSHSGVFFWSHSLFFRTPPAFSSSLDVSADPILPYIQFSVHLLIFPIDQLLAIHGRHHFIIALPGPGTVMVRKGWGVGYICVMYMCMYAWIYWGDIYTSLFPQRI